MRTGSIALVISVLEAACGDGGEEQGPIGPRFWLVAAGLCSPCAIEEMFRQGTEVELRIQTGDGGGEPFETVEHGIGELTESGLAAWEAAVASVDPEVIPNLPVCAPTDGIDVFAEVEGPAGAMQVAYCAHEPPQEVAQFDAYFRGLVTALAECESTTDIDVTQCE